MTTRPRRRRPRSDDDDGAPPPPSRTSSTTEDDGRRRRRRRSSRRRRVGGRPRRARLRRGAGRMPRRRRRGAGGRTTTRSTAPDASARRWCHVVSYTLASVNGSVEWETPPQVRGWLLFGDVMMRARKKVKWPWVRITYRILPFPPRGLISQAVQLASGRSAFSTSLFLSNFGIL